MSEQTAMIPPEAQTITIQDLPEWMRPRQHRPDYAFIAVFALCCVIALPWLMRSGVPNTPASLEQIARLSQMADNLESGILYPRWASHFHFGYGSPVFNYLAPLPHYIGGLQLLLGESSPSVVLATLMAASIFIAGFGMFSVVKRRWGDLSGTLAALMYLVAPPLLLNEPYIEVDLATVMAAAFFPCVLWAADRTLTTGDGRDMLLLSLLTGLLILSSNVMGTLLLVIAVGWAGWLMVLNPALHRKSAALGFALGVGVTAFFWVPALVEWDAFHWSPFEQTLRPLSLDEVLLPVRPLDANRFNLIPGGELGTATWVLFLLGSFVVMAELRRSRKALPALTAFPFIPLGILLLLIATQLPSAWLDSTAKFPVFSRLDLLIPVAACCAIMGGQCARALENSTQQRSLRILGLGLLAAVTVGSSFPILEPPPFVPYRAENPLNAYLQSELRGTLSGSFYRGHFLPADTDQLPAPSLALLDSYLANQVLKVEHASRLPRANFAILSHSPVQDTFRVETDVETTIEILTLNFLGWKASFQDRPIPVETSPESGFISVTVPPGRGNLRVYLGSTPARSAASVVTLLSLIVLGVATLFLRNPSAEPAAPAPTQQGLILSMSTGVLAILLILIGRNIAYPASSLQNITPYPLVYEGGIDLLGYRIDQSGDTIRLSLFWNPSRPNLADYQIEVAFIDPASEEVIARQLHYAPGGWATSYWVQSQYVEDQYYVRLKDDSAFQAVIRVTRCQTSVPFAACENPTLLRAFDPRGTALGGEVILPQEIPPR